MKNNMNINGTGTITDGDYNDISISGMGKLNGILTANKINISGNCSGEGSLKTNKLTINGRLKYSGKLEVLDVLNINGHSKICEELQGGKIEVAGNLSVNKNIEFEEMSITGRVSCLGDCEGANFTCDGEVKIDGLLSADNVAIKVYKGSKIKEIGGENITVKADRNITSLPIVGRFFSNKIVVDLIEGDNIYLEDTVARIVNGKNIVIGKGCDIEQVNFSDNLKVQDDAYVGQENRVDNIKLLGSGK